MTSHSNEEYFDCGARVRFLQDRLPSAELARRLGVPPSQIARWRQQKNLKVHTIERICEGLGSDLFTFFSWPPD